MCQLLIVTDPYCPADPGSCLICLVLNPAQNCVHFIRGLLSSLGESLSTVEPLSFETTLKSSKSGPKMGVVCVCVCVGGGGMPCFIFDNKN